MSSVTESRYLAQGKAGGPLLYETRTRPSPGPTEVLVETHASLVSGGTERAVRALARSSILSKAKQRPDLVRSVLEKARSEGISSTAAAIKARLSETVGLGYSASGVVLEVGTAVSSLRPADRVAVAGSPHGDLQIAPANLVAPLSTRTSFDEGAFGAVGAIALNGVRLAGITTGDRVLVVGLGLVGQLIGRLAMVAGGSVVGIDPVRWKRSLAADSGIDSFSADEDGWDAAAACAKGSGFDAVLVAAATSSSEPARRAAAVVRDQGSVVIVGDTGLELDRRNLYNTEAKLRVARSYGPGRYDDSYEVLGVDYPYGQARWTAGRNLSAVVDLVAQGRLKVSDLISHRIPFGDAQSAYDLIDDQSVETLGVILSYREKQISAPGAVRLPVLDKESAGLSVGAIGAGRFAREILLPSVKSAGFGPWRYVYSYSGSGAIKAAQEFDFAAVAARAEDVTSDPGTAAVLVASDHASHAQYVIQALEAGRHVFCEKPLAVTEEEFHQVAAAWESSPGCLLVGHNRRWSPAVENARAFLAVGESPLQIMYRVNAGHLPEGHWLTDRRQGGRLIGEVCHFIDTCNALVEAKPRSVTTLTSGRGELILDDDLTVMIGYANGSQAVITYSASSAVAAGKERIEVMGRSRHVIIEDFGRIRLNGPSGSKSEKIKPADKGHRRQLAVFAEMVRGERDSRPETEAAFMTSQIVFAAIRSAAEGRTVRLDSLDG